MLHWASSSWVHEITLPLPRLPATWEGLRIVQVSDLHIGRRRGRYRRLVQAVSRIQADLAFLTGDYMNHVGDEAVALAVLGELLQVMVGRFRLGIFGVQGNHDSPALGAPLSALPVRWLRDERVLLAGGLLEIGGLMTDCVTGPDVVGLVMQPAKEKEDSTGWKPVPPKLRLLLSHYPFLLPTAADLGFDVVFSGHTHGGQVRLPSRRALYNSCDLPLHLTSGVLRLHETLCVVSRGIGESGFPIRLFCPPHLPVYTLCRGPLPGGGGWHVENVQPW